MSSGFNLVTNCNNIDRLDRNKQIVTKYHIQYALLGTYLKAAIRVPVSVFDKPKNHKEVRLKWLRDDFINVCRVHKISRDDFVDVCRVHQKLPFI